MLTLSNVDRTVYTEELLPWLPERVIDIHTHVSLSTHSSPVSEERMRSNWAFEVGIEQSWEDLHRHYRMLFPQQRVTALAFGGAYRELDYDRENNYILAGSQESAGAMRALYLTRPEWDAQRIARAMEAGFLGIKPYPDLAPQEHGEVSIYDFLPHTHLQVVNELGGILMLHLPRAGRIADADNLREVREIAETYPDIRFILAHVGRAYSLPTAQRGLPQLADYPGIYFDIAANLNADVFQYALETVGDNRILFGSDLPRRKRCGA